MFLINEIFFLDWLSRLDNKLHYVKSIVHLSQGLKKRAVYSILINSAECNISANNSHPSNAMDQSDLRWIIHEYDKFSFKWEQVTIGEYPSVMSHGLPTMTFFYYSCWELCTIELKMNIIVLHMCIPIIILWKLSPMYLIRKVFDIFKSLLHTVFYEATFYCHPNLLILINLH